MQIRTILISLIMLCVLLAGCGVYDYSEEKGIPVSVGEDEEDINDFKSEFEKLQMLLEEGEEEEEDVVEIVEEEEVIEEVEEEEIPEGITTIKVKEGDLVNLAIKSEDADDDTITYTFTDPLDNDGKWQTDFGDAGKYKVTITASDGELSTSQDIYIVVEEVSRAPTIENFGDITVDEGDTVELKPKVTDPEEGSVTLEYSGWMTTSKKEVGYNDAGSYEVTLKATSSNGESATETITITVNDKNRAPKILSITNQ